MLSEGFIRALERSEEWGRTELSTVMLIEWSANRKDNTLEKTIFALSQTLNRALNSSIVDNFVIWWEKWFVVENKILEALLDIEGRVPCHKDHLFKSKLVEFSGQILNENVKNGRRSQLRSFRNVSRIRYPLHSRKEIWGC